MGFGVSVGKSHWLDFSDELFKKKIQITPFKKLHELVIRRQKYITNNKLVNLNKKKIKKIEMNSKNKLYCYTHKSNLFHKFNLQIPTLNYHFQ